MTDALDPQKFAELGRPRRVWAVASALGRVAELGAIHAELAVRVRPGDRLVYLGNLIGPGGEIHATLDAVVAFRAWLIAQPGWLAEDVVFLRGRQEELFQKALQLQFATDPPAVYEWMLRQGVGDTLASYGGPESVEEGRRAMRAGSLAIGRWAGRLREALRARTGHDRLMAALRRAALWRGSGGTGGVLLVHAGLDPALDLPRQKDHFWWNDRGFARTPPGWGGFARLVRGFDPQAQPSPEPRSEGHLLTLDGGCGRAGTLLAACLAPDGAVLDLLRG